MDVVIAHYKEDLEWLPVNPFYHYYIYSKSPDHDYGPVLTKHTNVSIIRLPNIGRESHTYLHHIIHNYERLVHDSGTRTTLFLQGRIIDHLHYYDFNGSIDFEEFMNTLHSDAVLFGKSQSTAKAWMSKTLGAHPEFRIDGPGLQKADVPLGKWFTDNVDAQGLPESAVWWVGALFAVRNDYIVSQPKEYYQNIYNQLNHPCPEIGHYLERSWFYLFKRSSTSACLCRTVRPLL